MDINVLKNASNAEHCEPNVQLMLLPLYNNVSGTHTTIFVRTSLPPHAREHVSARQ